MNLSDLKECLSLFESYDVEAQIVYEDDGTTTHEYLRVIGNIPSKESMSPAHVQQLRDSFWEWDMFGYWKLSIFFITYGE